MALKFYQQNSAYGKTIPYPSPSHPNATIATSGCGICAVMMAVWNYGVRLPSVRDFTKWAISVGARANEGTNMAALLNGMRKKGYIRSWRTTSSEEKFTAHVRGCRPAIVHCGGANLFSTSGHFVAAMSTEGSKICVMDPFYYSGKYTANAKRRAQLRYDSKRRIVLVSPADLQKDTKGSRYYLIEPNAPTPALSVGRTYTCSCRRDVYAGAGSNTPRKTVAQLTRDGKKHAVTSSGPAALKMGTAMTVQQIKVNTAGDIWVKIPSGWVEAYSDRCTFLI